MDISFPATSEPDREDLVERKVCEGYECGRAFFRRVPVNAKCGEKLCEKCRAKAAVPSTAGRGNHSKTFRDLNLGRVN